MKVISGGQTGVDRAALDAALALGIPTGGWCPKDRDAEDGRIPDRYPLIETDSEDHSVRTKENVKNSHGTLVLLFGPTVGEGTELTISFANQQETKPFIIDLSEEADIGAVVRWITDKNIAILNVAGPREGESPGIQAKAESFLRRLFLAAAKAESQKP